MTDPADGRRVAAALGLEPLEREGGLFRRVHTAAALTSIYYLVTADDFSAMHRILGSDELFFFSAGAPLEMLILDGVDGRREVVGPDPTAGQHPQLTVPADTWQGASSTGAWSLVSTVVVPPFDWSSFELGGYGALVERFPAWASRIGQLTR